MRYASAEEYLRDWPEGISGGKGSDTAKQQLNLQNQLTKQQLDLENKRLDMVSSSVGKYLTGSEGFDPTQLAAMRSQFLNQITQSYNQAGKNVMTALARRGSISSTQPVGGDYARGIASLEGASASDRASGLANIDLSNLQQALTNRFNAASLMNGQAATLAGNVGTFNSGANSALNSYITAANSGFGAAFTQALGGTLGKGIGTIATGGVGGALSGFGVPGMPKG